MSAGDVAVLAASVLAAAAAAGLLIGIVALRRQVDRLVAAADELGRQAVPLVADAHRVVDQAAAEMERVGAVLETTESVHATVDSASRLAYRAFANPVVKVLAARAGAATGIRQLSGRRRVPVRGGARAEGTSHGRARSGQGSGNARGSVNGNGSPHGNGRPGDRPPARRATGASR